MALKRRWLACAALALAAALTGVPAAHAGTVASGCAELQGAINAAAALPSHGEGEVIVLAGMCDAASLGTSAGVSVPADASITIEGAHGTTSGFDGAGVSAPLLHSAAGETAASTTLRNLTFRHANVTAPSGGALHLQVGHLTMEGDAFLENTLHGSLGGAVFVSVQPPPGAPACPTSVTPAAVTVVATSFRSNRLVGANSADGGALAISQLCAMPGSVLEGDTFEGNTIEYGGTGESFGAGLRLLDRSTERPTQLLQRGNVFDSNTIVSASTTAFYGGGGEWTEGADLTSVGDRFSRNAVPGSTGSYWSWGGGLGILNTTCNTASATESTLTDAVVSGNSLGPGAAGDDGGAGIYIGCTWSGTNPNHLLLLDSTVTENRAMTSGVSGIEGNANDHLTIENSIVAGDSGGWETGGFEGAGGTLTAAFSDVCGHDGAAPLPGQGNICADPRLVNDGNPASPDVHETLLSPTVDAGSDALLPAGLGSDYYGAPRVQPGHYVPVPVPLIACGCACPGSHLLALAGGVDMGAAELVPAPPPPALAAPTGACPTRAQDSRFSFPTVAQRRAGRLALHFAALAAGRLRIRATFTRPRPTARFLHGRRSVTRRYETVVYAHAALLATSGRALSLTLIPTSRGLAALERHRHLLVGLSITFTEPGLAPATQTHTIRVRWIPPRRRPRR